MYGIVFCFSPFICQVLTCMTEETNLRSHSHRQYTQLVIIENDTWVIFQKAVTFEQLVFILFIDYIDNDMHFYLIYKNWNPYQILLCLQNCTWSLFTWASLQIVHSTIRLLLFGRFLVSIRVKNEEYIRLDVNMRNVICSIFY